MIIFFLLLWGLFFLSYLTLTISQTYLPVNEYNTLYSLYNSTLGIKWEWQDDYSQYGYPWNFTMVDSDPCSLVRPWQGLNCSSPCDESFCHVISIQLNSYGLKGPIPSDISNLTYLITLSLNINEINETIPQSITQLSLLETLSLNDNYLTGTLPEEIGLLTQLQDLIVSYNYLFGCIPLSLSNLSQLSNLQLQRNDFSGSLSPSLGNLTMLQSFLVNNNQLTGTIPPELFNSNGIINLYLNSNSFSGSIPYSISNITFVQNIFIDSNILTGTIPNSSFPYLLQYSIDTNFFSGTIPAYIYDCIELQTLEFNSNQFTGSLSSEIGRLVELSQLSFYYNLLTGSFPSSIGNLTNLILIYSFKNLMSGPIPETIGNIEHLQYLDAYSNLYSSSIPSSIGLLANLYTIDLFDNQLTGSIPSEIANCTFLGELSLFSNHLTGSLPEQIFSFSFLLTTLLLFDNQLTGTLPPIPQSYSLLITFDLEDNLFSGSIPDSFNHLQNVMFLYLSSNRLTGTLSQNIFILKNLGQFSIYDNLLTGSLPQGYVYNSSGNVLSVIDVSNNLMTGQIPRSIQKSPYLVFLSVGTNFMTGTIPGNILNQPGLVYFEAGNNYFISTLPSESLHVDDQYKYLDFANNLLTGHYPYDVYNDYFKLLNYLSLANNFLSGPFPTDIGGSDLKVLYLQNNSFTGSISSQLAAGKNLSIFMASLNCLTGTIPDTFCVNSNLSQLILDGLHSSNGCIDRLFNFVQDSSYGIIKGVHGTIPACLFTLSSLKVLHLSGNNLHGTIPLESSQPKGSTHLHSLILANNLLTGTIPASLWTDEMVYLDLSFNRFIDSNLGNEGVLYFSNGYPSALSNVSLLLEPTLRLQVNHLSGKIPNTLIHNISSEVAIDILDGNMFVCDEKRDDLPTEDPNYHTYQCGSDYTNTSLYVALGFLVIFLTTLFYWNGIKRIEMIVNLVWKLGQENDKLLMKIKQTYDICFKHLLRTSKTLETLGRILIIILIWTILFLIPTYVELSSYYGTYIHQYIWVVSSAYLSGQAPAITLLCLFLCIVTIFNYFFLFSPDSLPVSQFVAHFFKQKNIQKWNCWQQNHWWSFLKLSLFICVETGIVLIVNFSYVLALNHGYNNVTITWISLAVSAFKLLWGNIMLLGFGRMFIEKYFQIQLHTAMIIVMSIFNNVIAPYLAEALVSSNCFYYAITSSPTVNTLYYDLKCNPSYDCTVDYESLTHSYQTTCTFQLTCDDIYELIADNVPFSDIQLHLSSSSYKPPFHYNYTCSSSLLSAFVYVFVYRYVFTGIIEPFIFYTLKWLQLNAQMVFNASYLHCVAIPTLESIVFFSTNSLTVLMKFMDSLDNKTLTLQSLHKVKEGLQHNISPAEKSIVRLITDITVMLSFGVLFPPLSILIFLSLMKDMVREQYYLAIFYKSYLYYSELNNESDAEKGTERNTVKDGDVDSSPQSEEISTPRKISQSIKEIIIQLDGMYEVWNDQFWTGWWWSGLVSVWFWSFALYDMLAIDQGPVQSIWIILVMGLSPYWIRGSWNLFVNVYILILRYKDRNIHNENIDQIIESDLPDTMERATELTNPRDSSSIKISTITSPDNNEEITSIENPMISQEST